MDKINIINTLMRLRQLSNHPKMIDSKSEMDSGKYIAVTRYLETLVQSNQKTIVFSSFVSNLNFYKTWCKENKIDFVDLDIEKSPEAKKAHAELGGGGVPVVLIGNRKIQGFNTGALEAALKKI